MALHTWLCYIRRPMPANLKRQRRFANYATLEEFYVADCFQQRGGGRYFEALFGDNPVYKEVLGARAANDGAYTVSYDGKDIECLNLSMTGPAYELPSRAERRKPVARRSAMLPPRTYGWVGLLSIPELQKLIKNPLIGGDLDGLKYEHGQKEAFVAKIVAWMKANEERPELRPLLKAPPKPPKPAGTQKRRKHKPKPGTDGSVDLSQKRPRVQTQGAAAHPAQASVRQSSKDRAARRDADRLAAQAQD